MALEVRSWSKLEGIPDLIGRKKVDWSIFRDGSHVPHEFIGFFEQANGGVRLGTGEKQSVTLVLENDIYDANLLNMDRNGYDGDTVQIRFSSSLKEVLKDRLSTTYNYVVEQRQRKQEAGGAGNIIVPDQIASYIDFYDTGNPFEYRLEIINPYPTIKNIHQHLQTILNQYVLTRQKEPFGGNQSIRDIFSNIEENINRSKIASQDIITKWSVGKGNWASVPWLAFLDSRETTTTRKGVYVVFLFCEDMSGIYLTLMQGVTDTIENTETRRSQARANLRNKSERLRMNFSILKKFGFRLDNEVNLHTNTQLGTDYEYGTIAYKYYKTNDLPSDEFISRDISNLLQVYASYINSTSTQNGTVPNDPEDTPDRLRVENISMNQRVRELIKNISSKGYSFEPWQIAAYITALRTKPFVILAGVSGTGKSKLPQLVAEATGGECCLLPVRPDWTDSSDVLGYCDLQGEFRPGSLLTWFNQASNNPDKHFVGIIDEMNLARVEHYFAEVLSQIENRYPDANGGFCSGVLINKLLDEEETEWAKQVIPGNFAIVGTVNMDESAYGFSRKVLDRAFTIEFSDINLSSWESLPITIEELSKWPVNAWYPRAIRLNMLQDISDDDRGKIQTVIQALEEINKILIQAQLQVAYRTRDEISLFVLHADEGKDSFVTSAGDSVDPLDLAIQMKVLPRIIGGSAPVRQVLLDLLGWASLRAKIEENDANAMLDEWIKLGRSASYGNSAFPRTAARLCLMWERLNKEGFTSYWM